MKKIIDELYDEYVKANGVYPNLLIIDFRLLTDFINELRNVDIAYTHSAAENDGVYRGMHILKITKNGYVRVAK